ncbi:DNA polymerase III subunit delta [Alterinioella nitratireducens]|uniref:DNA polymerase III subunit delta n=1 Tax=Alterinioella nitratireducens TaxID=2735915 RepID=UPI00155461A6|nr:DNA polymerase III subunit delta [Alterinioella nitratireducens]NPD20266.1 DNA polymerase III subunit delta [Alterinioella nitratireducens]
MKLTARDAAAYFHAPDRSAAGLLLYGADAMRVALKRQDVIEKLLGPGAEEEMRLTRIPASELRSDKAMLADAMRAVGFFPGPRVAFVEEAADGLAPVIKDALTEWREGDAQIIVTAKTLAPKSALRKLFESHKRAYAIGIYDEPPSRAEIEETLAKSGVTDVGRDGMAELTALAQALDPGDFRQTMEKLALYKMSDPSPVTSADIMACAPTTIEAGVDDILNAAAEGRIGAIGPLMQKLTGQGVLPVTLCIQALRHFRGLYGAAIHPGGASAGVGAMRPPVYGPRRDKMIRQAGLWGVSRLEAAHETLLDTDLALRSSQQAPQTALMERALIRLASIAHRAAR